MLEVASPAADLTLLSIEALRRAAGLAEGDSSRDEQLIGLGKRIAAEISVYCRVAYANGGEPTLRQEEVRQTFRRVSCARLMLARRHDVVITSIAQDGDALDIGETYVDREAGFLYRLREGEPIAWRCRTLIVTYKAGFEEVPADLSGAAEDIARMRLAESTRDPLVKGERTDVPGVLEKEVSYWVGAVPGSSSGGLPRDVAQRLQRYMNMVVTR